MIVSPGLCINLNTMYLSEISPVKYRGSIGTLFQLTITIGILCAQVAGLPELLGKSTEPDPPVNCHECQNIAQNFPFFQKNCQKIVISFKMAIFRRVSTSPLGQIVGKCVSVLTSMEVCLSVINTCVH